MKRLAILIAVMPTAAISEPPRCQEFTPVLDAYTANTRALSAMFNWCDETGMSQPACQKLISVSEGADLKTANAKAQQVLLPLAKSCLLAILPTPSELPE